MPSIHTIDLEFMGASEVIAAYVTPSSDGLIVVDCGPSSTLEKLYAGVTKLGFASSDIKHLLLTHIHLDHAGGAGSLARETDATVYVHRHGSSHLLRPERLLESATRIYGAMMNTLWGAFEPVPEDRLRVLEGTETLNIGGFEVRAVYTPGHAIHHLAYALDGHVFSGDVGGVRLPGASFVVAPTPPPDIDFSAWRESLEKLRALEPKALYPTHFGGYTDVASHLDHLEHNMNQLEALSLEVMRGGGGRDEIAERIGAQAVRAIGDRELERRYSLSTPYQMAADGLIRYWTKKRPEALAS
jgi:glyoxylase-like metal-dependent hydrolase (beta-lactamase superfamily II)